MVEQQETYLKNVGASLVREYLFRTVSPRKISYTVLIIVNIMLTNFVCIFD